MPAFSKKNLERLYKKYNRRSYVHPDPLEFLYNYKDANDREIAGLMASSLAYGRVEQILKSVSYVLGILGPEPGKFLMDTSQNFISKQLNGFRHRFTTGSEISGILRGITKIISQNGSLGNCFKNGFKQTDENIISGLALFVEEIKRASGLDKSSLLPDPLKGSACKRLNLFLRWMVRKDRVDPGGWPEIPASRLIVPLDTHMHRFGQLYGLTSSKGANLKAAIEITNGFKRIMPEDPVKYDFTITRFGIRGDMYWEDLQLLKSEVT